MFFRNRSGKSMLILLVGCGLVSVSLGVGAGLFLGKRAQASDAHGKHKKKPEPVPEKEIGLVYPIGEIVVNLADTDTMRYAKVTPAFGFLEKLADDKAKEKEAILRDTVISVLTRKTFQELHRREGIPGVKKEILAATRARVHDATIVEVYFEGFAMQ